MSTYPPRLEARVSAQERMQTILHARIEELAQDMVESFKQQAAYQVQFEQKVDTRFDRIEATMATKEDITALNGRFEVIEHRFDALENRIEVLFTQILSRLPEKP